MSVITGRKISAMSHEDAQCAQEMLRLLATTRTIALVAIIGGTLPIAGIIVWQLQGQLPLAALAGIATLIVVMDIVGAAVIWQVMGRQQAALADEVQRGQVEEIICTLPDGLLWYSTLARECNLPEGKASGAPRAVRTLQLLRRKLHPGQQVRLRVLPQSRQLLSAAPC